MSPMRGPVYVDRRAVLTASRDETLVIRGAWWYISPAKREVYIRLEQGGLYLGTVKIDVPRP